MLRERPKSTLFPYTTLFRSRVVLRPTPSAPPRVARPTTHPTVVMRSEEHTSELQSRGHLVCRLLLEKKKRKICYRRHPCLLSLPRISPQYDYSHTPALTPEL